MKLTLNRDTVSSVGFGRGGVCLSGSAAAAHACHIRHALALDECRVKFMPEYFLEMNSPDLRSPAEHAKPGSGSMTRSESELEKEDGHEPMVDTPSSEGSTLESMGSITANKMQPTVVNAAQPSHHQRTDRKSTDIKEVWFPGTHSDVYVCVDPVLSSLLMLLAEVGLIARGGYIMRGTSRSCGCVGRHLRAVWC